MYDEAKYQEALNELARQVASMVREDYPDMGFEDIIDSHLADYTCEVDRELHEEIQSQLQETEETE